MQKLFFLLLFFCISQYRSQIIELDSLDKNTFTGYDVYFIGERHGIYSMQRVETRLLELVSQAAPTRVLLEGPYDRNFVMNKVFADRDTSEYYPEFFHPYKTELFRYMFVNNIPVKAIDVPWTKYIWKDELLKIYKNANDSAVKKDIELFAAIGDVRFPHKKKNRRRYYSFLQSFYKNRQAHMNYLGKDSTAVDEYFAAFRANLLSVCDSSAAYSKNYLSNFREAFLARMVAKELRENSGSKIVSCNGNYHIGLQKDTKLFRGKDNWVSVATRTKNTFPEKKVCSIMMWRREDLFIDASSRYIKKHTERGKIYVINPDFPGTPFKELVGKITYMVIYSGL